MLSTFKTCLFLHEGICSWILFCGRNVYCPSKCMLMSNEREEYRKFDNCRMVLTTRSQLCQRCKQSTRCDNFLLLIYLNLLYMLRATNSPIFRNTFWLYIQLLVQCTDIAAEICICNKRCSWRWASLSPETCRADSNRSIKENCGILLVPYIVVLMMHGLTNVKFICAKTECLNSC